MDQPFNEHIKMEILDIEEEEINQDYFLNIDKEIIKEEISSSKNIECIVNKVEIKEVMEQTRATKTNVAQWSALVDFLTLHPEMVSKSFVGPDARQNYKTLWEEIAIKLNSMGFGTKTTEKWIDAFTKWKSKVKIKAQNIRLGVTKTGGSGPLPPLTPVEEKILDILGWRVVDGDATAELGLEITAPNCCDNTKEDATKNIEILPPPLAPLSKLSETEELSSPNSSQLRKIKCSEFTDKNSLLKKRKRNQMSAEQILKPSETEELSSPNSSQSRRRKCSEFTDKNSLFKKRKRNQMSAEQILLRVHEETLTVLKEISNSLSRIGDTQEALLNRLTCNCKIDLK